MLSLRPSECKLIEVLATRTPGTVPTVYNPPGEAGQSLLGQCMPAGGAEHTPVMPMSQKQPADLGLERFRDYLCLLARTHWHPRHYRRLDPSDIAQQTLLDAHQKLDQFRGSTDGELANWLRRILIHNVSDALRGMATAKRDTTREESLEAAVGCSFRQVEHFLAAVDASPSQAISKSEDLLALARGLERLPGRQREAVVLHYLQGMTVADLATHLECTEGAACALLHRALKQLRKLMNAGD